MSVETSELVKIGIALAGAVIAYRLGLSAYFRQKEFENVRTRYLDQGLELACSHVDYVLGVFRNNWALMLRSLRQYRDADQLMPFEDFARQLREVDQSYFQLTPVYKIKSLVGSDIFWVAHQKVFSFVGTANETIKADYGLALKEMLEHPHHPAKDEFLKKGLEKALELNQDAQRYYTLVAELQGLAEMLERENLSRDAVQTFRDREDVKKVIERVANLFPDRVLE